MTSWFELVRSRLDLPHLTAVHSAVPFGLPPIPGEEWEVGGLTEVNGVWRLDAHTGRGLEARYYLRFFADTRAVECWGEITNRGRTAVEGVTQSFGLDAPFEFSAEFGTRVWVRSLNGVQPMPTYFPPYDYAIVDRQLLDAGLMGSRIALDSAPGGMPSEGTIPCAILGDERGTKGVAFMIEWSGLWTMVFEGHPSPLMSPDLPTAPGLRIQIGIWGLNLDLHPGQSLPLPRVLLVAYDGDLDAGSNAIRRHIRRHVTPQLDGQEPLPLLAFNHWEGFQNAFTADILAPEVLASAEAGLEYFCVDAGWTPGGFRDGNGNWGEGDSAKFPDGIAPFSKYVTDHGLKYGMWFEPEWANVESDLYRAHPDWFLPTPSKPPAFRDRSLFDRFGEHNLDSALLDFGLPEVRSWWVDRITRAHDEWNLRWLRWDFNQRPRLNWDLDVPAGQIGWRQIGHVQGLYQVLDEIMAALPDLFISQCSGGGHRIELGTIRRGHAFWQNDIAENTDLVRAFQHGLNTILPGNYPEAHLCQPRHDYTDYDFLSHGTGGFGYSGRLSEAPRADFERYAAAIARFKGYRHLLLGDYSRPTGVARRADEYAKVVFTDGGESVAFEYNHDGPGSARVTR